MIVRIYTVFFLAMASQGICPAAESGPAAWDLYSDTWVATDDLGRALPLQADVGPRREGRSVGLFYFLWHGRHIQGGPYDVTKILQQDSLAMQKKESPLWGPMHAPHHWGESIFGYYRTDDEGVLRKHAQMLEDAGVDAIFFDVTNQLTYRPYYEALLKVFREVREQGGRPPRVAFLCPFWDPARVVDRLYRELYQPGLYSELWYRWEGKPLILADPAMLQAHEGNEAQNLPVQLEPERTLGQSFTVKNSLRIAGGRFPTWNTTGGAMTLSLYRGDGPGGEELARQRFTEVPDNGWMMVELPRPQPPGTYFLQMSRVKGKVGWWSHTQDQLKGGRSYADGKPGEGDRTLRLVTSNPAQQGVLDFFTFRKPQPDYFRGPTGPNMWSWLEVYPQHVFTNRQGKAEQLSVGVGQNAVKGRLGSMSESGAQGRSFHQGARDPRPDSVRRGLNVSEQWNRALHLDPSFIFITGWNEWIAGRFDEFNGIRHPVMFVDQFDQEHSRDIEPMKGGHGDDYYYQMTDYIRRYKGVRTLPPIKPQPIEIDGSFNDWREAQPEFRDTRGDPVRRNHQGWGKDVRYVNESGRQDIVAAKVSYDEENISFYVRTGERLIAPDAPHWMLLFLDADADAETGWLGYDYVVNRVKGVPGAAVLERNVGGGYEWERDAELPMAMKASELELSVPLRRLGLTGKEPAMVDFKWADHIQENGHWSDFTLNGDAAPNDRFNYRAHLFQTQR